jgi:hypothetical protein
MIMQRARSMTYIGTDKHFSAALEKAETKHVQVKRKPSNNSSTSIQLEQKGIK